jgi:hypothetical protein
MPAIYIRRYAAATAACTFAASAAHLLALHARARHLDFTRLFPLWLPVTPFPNLQEEL